MTFNFAPPLYIMITKFLLLLSTSMEYNQWLHDVLYKFSSLDNYRDSIHYRDSFTATIVIVKFLLSLSTTRYNIWSTWILDIRISTCLLIAHPQIILHSISWLYKLLCNNGNFIDCIWITMSNCKVICTCIKQVAR